MTASRYRERAAVPELAAHVHSVWCQEVMPGGRALAHRVLPDGCTDLLWRDGRLCVAGPDTAWRMESLPAGSFIVGIRFNPGEARPLFGDHPMGEWRDQELDLTELWGAREARELSERLAEAGRPREIAQIMERTVVRRLADFAPADAVVRGAVSALGSRRERPVAALAADFGISERQLRRRFVGAVGYSPKTLQGVFRLARALTLLRDTPAPASPGTPSTMVDIALTAGYADQPHMTRELGRLTGLTPARVRQYGT
ncbi:helix-turn-helix domain-containing protein [Kitasatospora purpeofusca]|uniref:helix-turn-helix domain-containing protein n=1 Tax=Kitasatospora purpeofusca TaxID=67352 RepID=UPI0036D40E6A